MTDAERAALVAVIKYATFGSPLPDHVAETIFAAIEGPIRADERARVVDEATEGDAVRRAYDALYLGPSTNGVAAMRAAIRAALGVGP